MLKRYFSKYFGNDKGFTMIEMMVVLIIIAVLIAGGIRFYLGYVERAKVTKAKSEITTMQAALDSYYAEKGEYPDDENDRELVKAGLATDRISISTEGNDSIQYIYEGGGNSYKIITTATFRAGKLVGEGQDGKSTEPDFGSGE
ncbi:fimbrial protein PilA [Thermacetogenium phaeum DSM 12270]|uniref:Fimbrial protein PilA n=1 Tax=Thermacetogenium phaeum (strain ATCC BAA-254 / DSM 26808 / PB) TaxID=1089553 RepID=K4LII6_THEPS|nr:prepilin-type N-terminal cleavage/methylation domain-containing protein [Thermacetogenium phaeum]AFV11867.1 fimbrial protein PilA [Thermacetogenium phaeum DSM 12270]